MWQFIISGYVPGTNVQITFDTVATIATGFLFMLFLRSLIKRRVQIQREIKDIVQKLETIKEISL